MKKLLVFPRSDERNRGSRVFLAFLTAGIFSTFTPGPAAAQSSAWQPAKGPLDTRWTKEVSPRKALPEYPRPQMVRKDWLCLNGLWDFAITAKDDSKPKTFGQEILVPFPVESALSGVRHPVKEDERLWYRRWFQTPSSWRDRRVLLHFGAVDFVAVVWVNGQYAGQHRGGYDEFTLDITGLLVNPGDDNELVVAAWDPTDGGTQPRGKQVRKPGGIFYTSTSGIWQTVWLEPVTTAYIHSLRITPDVDHSVVVVQPITSATPNGEMEITIEDSGRTVGTATGVPGRELRVPIKNERLWSPEDPHLYNLTVALKLGDHTFDRVRSYFGMRKISLGKDSRGFMRVCLNNRPYFQLGPLDQGFWPDGLYTAPTDEALRSDIEMTKELGFNLARKHVKVEPDRWYYWCDKLGLLVWQDMPSGDAGIGKQGQDITRTKQSADEYMAELQALIEGRQNHPCIVMWVPFNEGWGQWNTAGVVEKIKQWDPTRLVDAASGWTDRGLGDVLDMHQYPGPGAPEPETARAGVLGEFGGLGLPVRGDTWQAEKNWGYRSFKNSEDLTTAYLDLIGHLQPLIASKGLSAAVYTQLTDVEVEVNGLMTYDREVVKMEAKRITEANQKCRAAGNN